MGLIEPTRTAQAVPSSFPAGSVVTPDRLDGPLADPLAGSLFGPLATGAHWGLARVFAALADVGDPHLACTVIHVGGTNGKGSVASTLASVLVADGRRAACYLSPHLCSIRERMLVGGLPVTEEELLEAARVVRGPVIRRGLTFFEAVTVLAFKVFERARAEVAVVEVGLGGRLDATNVVRPEITAITNIALDHADYLGGTLESIAREKAGIVKEGAPLLTAEHRSRLLSLLRDTARNVGAPFHSVDPGSISPVEVRREGTSFSMRTNSWGELSLRTPLVGRHQATNAALAVSLLDRMSEPLRPSRESVLDGVAEVIYCGRNQLEEIDGLTWLFDGAHNTAGMTSLADTLGRLELPRPLVALVGVLGDKDWRSMLPQILRLADGAVLTQPPSASPERCWSIPEARDAVRGITRIAVEEDFGRALEAASSLAGGGSVVVCGSIYTVGSALSALGLEPLNAG